MAKIKFVPQNLDKYIGDPAKILARSKWEYAYMLALDKSIHVKKWQSEPKHLHIKYLDPITKKIKTYWPDFIVQFANNKLEIIEIKPAKEAAISEAKTRYDKLMLMRNMSKWKVADSLAQSIGATFRVVTEKQLFNKK